MVQIHPALGFSLVKDETAPNPGHNCVASMTIRYFLGSCIYLAFDASINHDFVGKKYCQATFSPNDVSPIS